MEHGTKHKLDQTSSQLEIAEARQKRRNEELRAENQKQLAIFISSSQIDGPIKTSSGDYKIIKRIGEGTYGQVYRAMDVRCNRAVAIKQMAIDPEGQGLPSVALREISVLGELQHRNVISLLDVIVTERALMVIFEHLDMDLREFQSIQIQKHKLMSFNLTRRIFYQIFQGLAYVHDIHHIIHRDIKPQNILVDTKSLIVKIADFGLARFFTTPLKEMTNEVVTLWYRPPELLMGSTLYTSSADVWSVGVMLIELIESVPPFDPDCEIRAIHMIFQYLGTPTGDCWPDYANLRHYCDAYPKWSPRPWREKVPSATPEAIDLISRMLVFNPTERITCEEATKHKMFDKDCGGEIRELFAEPYVPFHSCISPWSMPDARQFIQRKT